MRDERLGKTIGVALAVCLTCSTLVSSTVVVLGKIRAANERSARIRNMLLGLDLIEDGVDNEEAGEAVRPLLIELETGAAVPEERYYGKLNARAFDIRAMSTDPEYSREIPEEEDMAGIRRMPEYMAVYLLQESDGNRTYVLPVYGAGLYSVMYGYVALRDDLRTIEGIYFYEHGETPGLGAEIDNPEWKKKWKGKPAFDDDWNLKIEVVHGLVNASMPNARYKVDGLSGATYTTRGVDQLVRFWLGNKGYGPFLKRLRQEKEIGQT